MPRLSPPIFTIASLIAWTTLTCAASASAQDSLPYFTHHLSVVGSIPADDPEGNSGMSLGAQRAFDPLWDRGTEDEKPDGTTPWTLSLEAVTHAPVDAGGQILFETPFGLRVGTGFGWVPQTYIDWISQAAEETGAVDGDTGSAVRNSFSGGNVWHANVGVRPVGGFYFDAGYALVRLRGTLAVSELASAANIDSAGFVPEGAGINVRSTLHMWTLEVGWQTHIADRVVLGFGAGIMGTISASSTAEPDFDVPDIVSIDPFVAEATQTADDRVKRYGFIPTVTGQLGYDFL